MTAPKAYVFDAYGTLFDVHSVIEAGGAVTSDPQALSTLWRQKQLEYTWLRSLMGRYEDFWAVTESALRFALRRLGITAGEAQIKTLMEAYLSLACFPEVADALARLAPQATISLQQGDEGSTVLEGGRVFRPRRRPTVQVVDPIGAGDAYAAGFLWAVLHGRDLQDAVDAGTAVAALKCSTWGDIALVSAQDVGDVLAGGPDVRR